jgi:hypothetical protein
MTELTQVSETLSFDAIQNRYPNEWVLIAYTELDENLKAIAGEVLIHSPERDVVYEALLTSTEGRSVAIEYMGTPPENWALML